MLRPLAPLLVLAGCTVPIPEAPVAGGERPFEAAELLRDGRTAPFPDAFRTARRGSPPPAADVDLMSAIGSELTGGELDQTRGGDLVAALAEAPPEDVEAWGAGALTLTELFGARGGGGLCEEPHALFSFEEDGKTWDLKLRLFGLLQLTSPLTPLFMELTPTCADAVTAASGDVDAAVDAGSCSAEEAYAFFPEGGDCRACAAGASVADCIDAGVCKDEAPQVWENGGEWFEWAEATVLACAPDVPMKLYMGARDIGDDGTIPPAWNQTDWPRLCFALRDEATGEVGLSFVGDSDGWDDITDGYGDGVLGRIEYLREAGETGNDHSQRVTYNRRLRFADGTMTEQMVLSFGGTGQVSAPLVTQDGNGDGVIDSDDWGYGYGGWGWSPVELRPDGTDPTDVNDTYARDWIAGVVTKMSTTRDGVPINDMNWSRCTEWVGPADDGSHTCVAKGPPTIGMFMDNHVFWYNREHTMVDVRPMITLGSTGLPDDLMPGGFTPHLAGTAALANPDWDACPWPHQFVPDHIVTEDTPDSFTGPASLDADTYRFGKDPDQDIRMVLATTQERGFCPPTVE